jgi:hypothetical protein
MSAVLETTPTTVKTYLRPIDRDGLMAFAEKGRNNPASRGTNKVHTVTEGQYRTLSYVGDHAPVVVDEPLHLFGEDTAPAPGEIVLSGLGGCLAVGITAVATWKQVKLTKLEHGAFEVQLVDACGQWRIPTQRSALGSLLVEVLQDSLPEHEHLVLPLRVENLAALLRRSEVSKHRVEAGPQPRHLAHSHRIERRKVGFAALLLLGTRRVRMREATPVDALLGVVHVPQE